MSCKQSDRYCVDSGAQEDKSKRLRCFVVGCNNEFSSRYLLLTSELLKMQRINVTLILKGKIPICLNVCIFARIIRDPASPTEEVSIRVIYFYYSFCKSPFLIMC